MIYEEDSRDTILSFVATALNQFLLEKQNIKLIAFGDSITAAGASPRTANGNYIFLTGGYWVDAWVQSDQQFEMLDGVGVSGNTTLDLLNRMDDVLLSPADVVMILVGTNDLSQGRTPEQTRDSMVQILDQIITAGKKVLITPVPLREVADNLNEKINTLNAYYSELTAERSSHVVMTNALTQFNQFIEDGNELVVTTDGLHPNTYGAWLIARETKLALDKYFNSLPVDYINLAPNPEFSGFGGYVLSGATGQAPDGWGVYYADPSNGLGIEDASVVNADGSVSLKTGTVAPYNQVFFKSNKVTTISKNKRYSFGLTVSCSDLSNVSAMRLYMNGSTAPIKSVEFQLKVPAGLTSFDDIKLRTPFIDVGDSTYVELYLTVTSNGTAPIELSISNPVLIEQA